MDLKKEAARVAYSLIRNNSSIGLGGGSSIRWLASYLMDGINGGLNVRVYTSSFKTQQFLQEAGLTVSDISLTDSLSLYFDECDQLDIQFNALKSGAGIHPQEKLQATMAMKFVILVEESKFISNFDPRYPLVLEVLPQATGFVLKMMKATFPKTTLSIRRFADNAEEPVITRNGNFLIDCRFPEWPEPEFIQKQCKNITGVVEISLFYRMVNEAIIAGNHGVFRYQRKNDLVSIISQNPLELI
jgi:ribose 5-phosphate isomerase A